MAKKNWYNKKHGICMRALWVACPCGCGKFFQRYRHRSQSTARQFAETSTCVHRCNKKRKDYGTVIPKVWEPCGHCGEPVPVYTWEEKSRCRNGRVLCGKKKCAREARRRGSTKRIDLHAKGPNKRGLTWEGREGFRHQYCSQRGQGPQCENYSNCLWEKNFAPYTETKGQCYRKPTRQYIPSPGCALAWIGNLPGGV